MSPSAIVILVLTVAVVIGAVIALSRQGHPEDSAGHDTLTDDPSTDQTLRLPGGRPGGPGQAGQNVVGPGEITPGDPGAEGGGAST